MNKIKVLQSKIKSIQKDLVQISFESNKNRIEVYANLLDSLHDVQNELVANKKLLKENRNGS